MKLGKVFFIIAMVLCSAAVPAQTDSTFYIKGSMGRLAARLQLPEMKAGEKCHMVVVCHGFTSNMDDPVVATVASQLLETGFGVLRFDFNGHGRSEGDFAEMTVPNEIGDALAAVAFARNLPQAVDVSLVGHSQGGVVAAMTAGRLGSGVIRSLVLMAPAAVLRDDALRGNTMGATYDPWHAPEYVTLPSGHKLGRAYIQTAIDLPIYETAARYYGPVLVIHGMADRVVPYTYGQRFGREMPDCAVRLIPGDDHVFSANKAYAASLASEWLVKTFEK